MQGKLRSEADKARISAGVRARNRAILLAKLEKLGISEDEWHEKQKQIKYLRERVRKARQKNKELAQQGKEVFKLQAQLEEALKDRDRVKNVVCCGISMFLLEIYLYCRI